MCSYVHCFCQLLALFHLFTFLWRPRIRPLYRSRAFLIHVGSEKHGRGNHSAVPKTILLLPLDYFLVSCTLIRYDWICFDAFLYFLSILVCVSTKFSLYSFLSLSLLVLRGCSLSRIIPNESREELFFFLYLWNDVTFPLQRCFSLFLSFSQNTVYYTTVSV